ncbi:MAG: hypothetical protein PUC00_07860 [Clostridiales bacterium]|nr:hypothetical protein [Clostridiales bacterium]
MRKILSLALCLMMVLSCIPAFAEEDVAVKTGLSFVVSLEKSKDGQSQANMPLTAVAVDDNGVITACVIDYIQAKVKFDENGKITSDLTAEVLSKNELGDGYGMRKASSIAAEWNEQAAAFAAYCVGKTVEELSGMAVNENGVSVDLAASCTLTVNEFLPGVVDAVNNAAHRGAKKSDVLKLTQVSSISKSKDATAEAEGQTQVYTHVGMFTLNGNVITSAYIDAVQANVKFDAQGKVTSDITAPVATKNVIKDGYGMRPASAIGKEWFEQTAFFCEFITGKTLEEAVVIAREPANSDVVSGCTIKTGDFLKLLVKAAQ